jgi:hypothetical protein
MEVYGFAPSVLFGLLGGNVMLPINPYTGPTPQNPIYSFQEPTSTNVLYNFNGTDTTFKNTAGGNATYFGT